MARSLRRVAPLRHLTPPRRLRPATAPRPPRVSFSVPPVPRYGGLTARGGSAAARGNQDFGRLGGQIDRPT